MKSICLMIAVLMMGCTTGDNATTNREAARRMFPHLSEAELKLCGSGCDPESDPSDFNECMAQACGGSTGGGYGGGGGDSGGGYGWTCGNWENNPDCGPDTTGMRRACVGSYGFYYQYQPAMEWPWFGCEPS